MGYAAPFALFVNPDLKDPNRYALYTWQAGLGLPDSEYFFNEDEKEDGQPASHLPGSLMWSVYIVQCADGTLYTGVAKDVDGRLARHNDGVGAKYTRSRLPVRLVFREEIGDQGSALRRETDIKALSVQSKRELIKAGAVCAWDG